MEISRSRSLTISMGDYESFKTEATVRMELADDAHTPEGVEKLQLVISDQLDRAMAEDIADAQALTGNRKSFIHKIGSN